MSKGITSIFSSVSPLLGAITGIAGALGSGKKEIQHVPAPVVEQPVKAEVSKTQTQDKTATNEANSGLAARRKRARSSTSLFSLSKPTTSKNSILGE